MPNTFTKIASVTVGAGGAASMSFTSIPATYTDLCIKLSGRSARAYIADNLFITFNSSGGTYSMKALMGNGTSPTAASYAVKYASFAIDGATATASTFSNQEIYIPNYAGSIAKSYSADSVSENNATDAQSDLVAGSWTGTAAITSIGLQPEVSTWVQYTTATLYGIKNS
jgi:hypothetical protein